MAEPREPILPDGISDLYDLVQRKEEAERKLRQTTSIACRWLVPILIEKLAVKIDYDLISAEDKDLVQPLIRETAVEELQRITGELSHDAIASRMLDFLTEETWLVMLDPNKNTTYSNVAPTDVASLERALREFQSIQRELRE
jgi:hypothetical protein